MVQCQEERSQIKNKERAFEELRTRLYNLEHQKYLDGIAAKRKTMVSTGDRSAKIRTYNYPQGRVTDHRINWSMYNLRLSWTAISRSASTSCRLPRTPSASRKPASRRGWRLRPHQRPAVQ